MEISFILYIVNCIKCCYNDSCTVISNSATIIVEKERKGALFFLLKLIISYGQRMKFDISYKISNCEAFECNIYIVTFMTCSVDECIFTGVAGMRRAGSGT